VGDLTWEDVKQLRERKELKRLRSVLRELEIEAFEVATDGGDLVRAMREAHDKRVWKSSEDVSFLRSVATTSVTEFVVGVASGMAITGFTSLGPALASVAGAGVSAALITGKHMREFATERRQRGWIGVLGAIAAAAEHGET
jgi:hypothetical protein